HLQSRARSYESRDRLPCGPRPARRHPVRSLSALIRGSISFSRRWRHQAPSPPIAIRPHHKVTPELLQRLRRVGLEQLVAILSVSQSRIELGHNLLVVSSLNPRQKKCGSPVAVVVARSPRIDAHSRARLVVAETYVVCNALH